jgi:hypothetical protein
MLTTPEFLGLATLALVLMLFGEGLCLLIGYVIFGLVTLGSVKLEGAEHKGIKFPWHGFARTTEGPLVVQASTASLLGILVLLGVAALVIAWRLDAFSR